MYLSMCPSAIQFRLTSRAKAVVMLGLTARVAAIPWRRRECIRKLFDSHGFGSVPNEDQETGPLLIWIWKVL